MRHLTHYGMRGYVRPIQRQLKCPKCSNDYTDLDDYYCSDCHTSPDRFYVDVHFKGKRFRFFCDRQGKPLDTYDRAYDLLVAVNYEIKNYLFDPSKYIKSEQKEFYVCTQLGKYEEYKVASLAPSYQTDFKRQVRIAKEFFNTKDVREIRKSDLISYQSYITKTFTLSNKTIKNIMDVFKAFLNYLKNDVEMISVVPNFPDIEVEIKPFKWLSQEDQIALFVQVPALHKPIMAFLMLHGCRPSEARALRCKNVDLTNKTITICATFSGSVYREKRKGKRSRPLNIPIHPELYPYVTHRVKNNLPEAYVFVNGNTGNPYNKNVLQKVWADIRTKTGLDKGLRLYDATRHSFASNLVNSGSSIYKVSKLLGHSSVKMTEKYAHSEVDSLRTDVQKLSLKCHQSVNKGLLNGKK